MSKIRFWDILDHHMMNPPIPRLRPSKGFYPSESSIEYEDRDGNLIVEGECLRKLWYRRKGIQPTEKTDLDSLWKMDEGDQVHQGVVEKAKQARIYVGDEVEFWDEVHKISGRIDLFILHPETGRIQGVEIKTIGGYYQIRTIIDPTYGRRAKPKREHVMQATVYLDWFSKHQNVHEWWLAYIDRESGRRRDFLLTLSPTQEVLVDGEPTGIFPAMLYARLRKLEEHLRHDMVPERDFELQYAMPKLLQMAEAGELGKDQTEKVRRGKSIEKGDWQCNIACPFKSLCWGLNGGQGRVTVSEAKVDSAA